MGEVRAIKRKEDAEIFVKSRDDFKEEDGFETFHFLDTSTTSPGDTEIGYVLSDIEWANAGSFYIFSWGPHWWCRKPSVLTHDEVVSYVWRHREDINQALSLREKGKPKLEDFIWFISHIALSLGAIATIKVRREANGRETKEVR